MHLLDSNFLWRKTEHTSKCCFVLRLCTHQTIMMETKGNGSSRRIIQDSQRLTEAKVVRQTFNDWRQCSFHSTWLLMTVNQQKLLFFEGYFSLKTVFFFRRFVSVVSLKSFRHVFEGNILQISLHCGDFTKSIMFSSIIVLFVFLVRYGLEKKNFIVPPQNLWLFLLFCSKPSWITK